MGRLIDDALAGALARGRERYNAQAAEARLLGGGFAEEAFTAALTGPVDRLATAVAQVRADALDDVVDVAYRAAMLLTGRGVDLVGEGPLAQLWDLLAGSPGLVAEDPSATIGGFSNATLRIRSTPRASAGAWVDRLGAVARLSADAGTWRRHGRIVAWGVGLAQHRHAALAAIAISPADAVAVALGVPRLDGWDPRDRWRHPAAGPSAVVMGRPAGDFVGLGGPFSRPPTVWVDPDGAPHASAGADDGVWRIHADAFGTVLTRAHPSTPRGPAATANGWPAPPGPRPTSVAVTADTMVWASDASYRVGVAGRPGGAG